MQVKQWVCAHFSPTGGTKAVADQVALGLGGEGKRQIDLTAPVEAECLGEDRGLLVAVPVYGGRVPELALERLAALRGENTPAVAVVVYGNRAYEDALLELKNALEGAGFRVVAAGAFVAEHSMMRTVAAGRPDEADRKAAVAFGRAVVQKLEEGAGPCVQVPGNPVYKERKGGGPHPTGGKDCIACGLCVQSCPVEAIPAEKPTETDGAKCIHCMRCVMRCPVSTRKLPRPALLAIEGFLAVTASGRKEPETFL